MPEVINRKPSVLKGNRPFQTLDRNAPGVNRGGGDAGLDVVCSEGVITLG